MRAALSHIGDLRGTVGWEVVMVRRMIQATLMALLGASPLAAQGADPLAAAAWLAGCWELRTPTRVTTEMWMPAAGGMMLGAGRTVVEGTTREFEHLRLHAEGDRLVYTALPSGQAEGAFTSPGTVLANSDSLEFENRAHDFPQRLVYHRLGADSMRVHVEGPGPGGAVRGFDQPMKRVRCEPPA